MADVGFTFQVNDNCVVMHGDLDYISDVEQLIPVVRSIIDRHVDRFVLDMRDIAHIDSKGVLVVVEACQYAKKMGMKSDAVIVLASPAVARILRVTGLERLCVVRPGVYVSDKKGTT